MAEYTRRSRRPAELGATLATAALSSRTAERAARSASNTSHSSSESGGGSLVKSSTWRQREGSHGEGEGCKVGGVVGVGVGVNMGVNVGPKCQAL